MGNCLYGTARTVKFAVNGLSSVYLPILADKSDEAAPDLCIGRLSAIVRKTMIFWRRYVLDRLQTFFVQN